MNTLSKNKLTLIESLEARALLAGSNEDDDGIHVYFFQESNPVLFNNNSGGTFTEHVVDFTIAMVSALLVHKAFPAKHMCAPIVYGTLMGAAINWGIHYAVDTSARISQIAFSSLAGAGAVVGFYRPLNVG